MRVLLLDMTVYVKLTSVMSEPYLFENRYISVGYNYFNMDLVQVIYIRRHVKGGHPFDDVFIGNRREKPKTFQLVVSDSTSRTVLAQSDDESTILNMQRQLMELMKVASGTVMIIENVGTEFALSS